MKRYTILILIFSATIGCTNDDLEKELIGVKEKLVKTEATLAALRAQQLEEESGLVHMVYFKLKPGVNQEKLIAELNELKAIEEVQALEIGVFEDLGDDRALSAYQMMMSMGFKNKDDYEAYQNHEVHLALKANLGPFLAGPPATYDYLER